MTNEVTCEMSVFCDLEKHLRLHVFGVFFFFKPGKIAVEDYMYIAILGFELRALHITSYRQVFYHLSQTSDLFCSGYFGARVLFIVQVDLDHNPPILNFWPLLGQQVSATTLNIFPLGWSLANFFFFNLDWPGTMIFLILASQVARIIDMSFQ
jgi:hypothetical protein